MLLCTLIMYFNVHQCNYIILFQFKYLNINAKKYNLYLNINIVK